MVYFLQVKVRSNKNTVHFLLDKPIRRGTKTSSLHRTYLCCLHGTVQYDMGVKEFLCSDQKGDVIIQQQIIVRLLQYHTIILFLERETDIESCTTL